MTEAQTLPALFAQALRAASKASQRSALEPETQELVLSAQQDLKVIQNRINALSLFSENEVLEDISNRDLVYLFVPFVDAEVQDRVHRPDPVERLQGLRKTQAALSAFVEKLLAYEIIPATERELYEKDAASIADAARRREVKLKQWKQEKELVTQIEELQKKRRQRSTLLDGSISDMDLIASLLPVARPGHAVADSDDEEEDGDSETADLLRKSALMLLRLMYTRARSRLESAKQETALLQSMPPPPPSRPEDDPRDAARKADGNLWRLDQPVSTGGPDGRGPLMDASGKPLRPFTILPAGASADRARLQGQVFRPDHRLPTMSIDEYLAIEQERGNIISGGGKASEEALTTSEQLALDAEQDGTAYAETREEERRQKDENWARFTDVNPKGAGNTMNRG